MGGSGCVVFIVVIVGGASMVIVAVVVVVASCRIVISGRMCVVDVDVTQMGIEETETARMDRVMKSGMGVMMLFVWWKTNIA